MLWKCLPVPKPKHVTVKATPFYLAITEKEDPPSMSGLVYENYIMFQQEATLYSYCPN